MSREIKIRILVSLVVALIVLLPFGLRWQAQWRLHSYRKKLIAAGEKLTVEELAPKRNAQATNTARFLKLASTLPQLWDCYPSAMHAIKPGVARVAWRQSRLMQQEDYRKPALDVWPAFTEGVRTNEQALGELQALVEEGGIEFVEDYSQLYLTGYTYLSAVKQVVIFFNARAILAMHQRRMQEAYQYLKDCGAASQFTAEDPLEVDQLVRYACMSLTATGCWEALQAGGWTDGQLAELQRQWDQPAILAAAERSLAMERARMPMEFQIARGSRQAMIGVGVYNNGDIWNDFLLRPLKGIDELLSSYPRYWSWRWIWSYRDERRYLEFMQPMIEGTWDAQKRLSILSYVKDRKKFDFIFPAPATNFDFSGARIAGAEIFLARALRAQTVANMVATAIALERYRLAHHAYPAALAKLAPDFVKTVQIDCMDGHDLRYRLNADGTYLLYSVGDDGVDSGGDPTPQEGKSPSFYNGRDMVWPRAATAEEVQAWEAEQSKPTR